MRADYDVVILGDSYSARWAALKATQQYARVALVLQSQAADIGFPATIQTLADIVTSAQSHSHSLPFTSVGELNAWMQRQSKDSLTGLALKRLSQLGVDVIRESGLFIQTSTRAPIFAVQNRQLRSRRYLLALEPAPLDTSTQQQRYHCLQSFLAALETHGQRINTRLECSQAWVLTLGQVLNKLGHPVTLAFRENLLPGEDPEVNFLVQCTLESQGLMLHRSSENATNTTDTLYFEPQYHWPYETLGLQQIGVSLVSPQNEPRFEIMPDLRTENSHMYVSTRSLSPAISLEAIQHSTAIALNNLLFNLQSTCEQQSISQSIPIGMGLCRRGLTEPEARRQFQDVDVMHRSVQRGHQSLFCKLVTSRKGEILGMHVVGLPSSQSQLLLQHIFAQHPLIPQLDELEISHPILQQILHDFAHRWRQIKFPKSRDRRERYFRAKRKRFS